MKLVIGGRAQGKCALLLAREGLSPADVCDGETCPLDPPPETPVINHVHLLARRLLEAGRDPVEILARYADAHPDAIFISDEVGCGVVPLDREFVDAAARICKERDILLMVDEVQTGIGRTGKLLCCEHYGITPDLVSLAKGLGGGLPLGAVLFGENAPTPSARATTPPPSAATRWPARALWRCSDALTKGCFRRSRKRARTSQGRSKGCRTS